MERTGQQVFGDKIDEVLAGRIVRHAEENATAPADTPPAVPFADDDLCRMPAVPGLAVAGIVALVAAAVVLLLSRFLRKR